MSNTNDDDQNAADGRHIVYVHERDDFVTDAEIARRWGVGEKTARIAIRALEAYSHFPKRDPLFANKRFWPAVRAFMLARAGVNMGGPPKTIDGKETFDADPANNRRRRRTAR